MSLADRKRKREVVTRESPRDRRERVDHLVDDWLEEIDQVLDPEKSDQAERPVEDGGSAPIGTDGDSSAY